MNNTIRTALVLGSVLAATSAHAAYRIIPVTLVDTARVQSNCLEGSLWTDDDVLEGEYSYNPRASLSAAALSAVHNKLNDGNASTAVTVTLYLSMTVNFASVDGASASAYYGIDLYYGNTLLDTESDSLDYSGSGSGTLTFTIPEGTDLRTGSDLKIFVDGGAEFQCGGPPGVSASVYTSSAKLNW